MGGHGPSPEDNERAEKQLASDGFLNNVASLCVQLCSPLLTAQACASTIGETTSPLVMIKPAYVRSEMSKTILPGKQCLVLSNRNRLLFVFPSEIIFR